MKKIVVAACMAAALVSCKKDAGDSSSPVIAVTSPSNHQSFAAGQAVTISATITDNGEIHEVHLFVTNKANNAEILHFEEHTDSKSYTLLKTFTVLSGITYKIEVQANDHAANESNVELEVTGK